MELKKSKQIPDAILCSDLHIRDTVPRCREDDYFYTQIRKLNGLVDLQKIKDFGQFCPIFCAGDLFDKAKSSNYLVREVVECFKNAYILSIPGQHDLPNHNIENFNKSSFGLLSEIYNETFPRVPVGTMHEMEYKKRKVGLIHTFVQKPRDRQDKEIGGYSAKNLLKKYSKLDLILTGDNHKTFVVKHEGRLLVNPGSMMRMTAAQIDHKPCVFLWYAKTNTVEKIYWEIEDGVISREHIDIKEKKEERFEAFINRVKTDYEISLSYRKNLEEHFKKNKTRKGIVNIIREEIC